jgi:hypothetical protein
LNSFLNIFKTGWRWTALPVLAARQQLKEGYRRTGLYSMILFGVLYALLALELKYCGIKPLPAWMAVTPADYLWQAILTLPWVLAGWALAGVTSGGLLKAFGGKTSYREWLDLMGPATAVPAFFLIVLVQAIGALLAGSTGVFPWPPEVEVVRQAVPILWMLALVLAAARVYLASWQKAVGVSLVYVVIFVGLLLLLIH